MSFRVTDQFLLRVEADRIETMMTVRGIGTDADGAPRIWEVGDFISHLNSLGLTYTDPQLVAIRDELITRGVLQF